MPPQILCFSSTDWKGNWGSRQQVMLRFAQRGYKVLFIEQLAGIEHLGRYPKLRQRRLHRWREGMKCIAEGLWMLSPPPLLPGRYYSPMISRINARLIYSWIKPYLKELNFLSPVLWVYKPEHAHLVGVFQEVISVYHCIDEWRAGTSGRKRHVIARLETELLENIDLVFANSSPLYENKSQTNFHTYRIPSGADVGFFAQALDPAYHEHQALKPIPRPRIGYCGTIDDRLDFAILNEVAETHPDFSLVLIGESYVRSLNRFSRKSLEKLPNIYLLGNYSFESMPSLVKGLDVCLIPYVADERGYYRSPLKLYEYLSSGKPVVTVDHPEAREFSSLVEIATNSKEFVSLIERALANDNPDLQRIRYEAMKDHSWENRVDEMEAILQRFL